MSSEREPTLHLVVRPAAPAEFGVVLPMCVEAFADEAVSAWVEPDPDRRRERTRELFETSIRAAIAAGQLVVAFTAGGDPVAASIWIDLGGDPAASDLGGVPPAPEADGFADLQGSPERLGPDHLALDHLAPDQRAARRLTTVLSATGDRHPDVPHIYLSAMAALPRRRGFGAGTAMLRHGLDRARALGLPVYLEASTPQNRRLYARHGFQDDGEPIQLPEAGPSLQPMWHPCTA